LGIGTSVTLRIADIEFDHVRYDAQRDVLYLSVGEPREAADSVETPEGHLIRYDERGEIIGLTFVNAKWLTDRDGGLSYTVPVSREVLEPAFA
jgi:uncharacterized protein YuzE